MKVSRKIVTNLPGLEKKIWEARKLSPYTLQSLCDRAGISVPHWYKIEKGEIKELPEDTLRGIEFALGKRLYVP